MYLQNKVNQPEFLVSQVSVGVLESYNYAPQFLRISQSTVSNSATKPRLHRVHRHQSRCLITAASLGFQQSVTPWPKQTNADPCTVVDLDYRHAVKSHFIRWLCFETDTSSNRRIQIPACACVVPQFTVSKCLHCTGHSESNGMSVENER